MHKDIKASDFFLQDGSSSINGRKYSAKHIFDDSMATDLAFKLIFPLFRHRRLKVKRRDREDGEKAAPVGRKRKEEIVTRRGLAIETCCARERPH